MKAETREKRRNEILDAALAVLAERGYRDASMLEVARRASASKETLYTWFGDKQGLFDALIRRNAAAVGAVVDRHLECDLPVEQALADFGEALLGLLLGDDAVAINRAAVSEAASDPTLARTLASAGRDSVLPGFVRLLRRHAEQNRLRFADPERAAEDFLGLLLGDAQVRRLLGIAPTPPAAEIAARAAHATRGFLRLYGPSEAKSG